MNKDNGILWSSMCSLIEILWVLIVGNSRMMFMLQKFLNLTFLWTFLVGWVCGFVGWLMDGSFDILIFDCLLKAPQPVTGLFLGGLSLHLNHLIESRMTNYDWPFGTLPFGLFGSNLDTRDLQTYPRTYSGHFWNMSIFDDSRAVWVLFRKWVVSENQSFLDEGVIVTPLLVWI